MPPMGESLVNHVSPNAGLLARRELEVSAAGIIEVPRGIADDLVEMPRAYSGRAIYPLRRPVSRCSVKIPMKILFPAGS
jgi:hypothetical protein